MGQSWWQRIQVQISFQPAGASTPTDPGTQGLRPGVTCLPCGPRPRRAVPLPSCPLPLVNTPSTSMAVTLRGSGGESSALLTFGFFFPCYFYPSGSGKMQRFMRLTTVLPAQAGASRPPLPAEVGVTVSLLGQHCVHEVCGPLPGSGQRPLWRSLLRKE